MKTAILKTISTLPFEVLAYIMEQNRKANGCNTLNELAEILAQAYIKEDLPRLNSDLTYSYECYLKHLNDNK